MNVSEFTKAFNEMRVANLGKTFERRQLGLLALQFGIYCNSTMWACGLGTLLNCAKVGPKYVYSFKNTPVTELQIRAIRASIGAYKRDTVRTIEHAKMILRRYGIEHV